MRQSAMDFILVSRQRRTNNIDIFEYTVKGQRVFLIDTPGFNDTTRSDVETLEILATYLGASYANGVRIHGVLMLHPITNNRMSGSSLRYLAFLKAICGFESYRNLVIVTTMWPEEPSPAGKQDLDDRENELLTQQRFFGDLIAEGASLFRHYEHGHRDLHIQRISAQSIMTYILRKTDDHTMDVLQLQRELVDEKKTLAQTTAGVLTADYLRKARQTHETRLSELESERTGALGSGDTIYKQQLMNLEAEVNMDIQRVERDCQALTRTIAGLHQAETEALKEEIARINRRFRNEVRAKERVLQEAQILYLAHQQEVALIPREPRNQHTITRCTTKQYQNLRKARKDAEKARRGRNRVQEYTREVMGGVMNGLAAGAIAGAMGAACEVM
ncbi:P-loop containing nucleoside triphosphate hydrolase protein [Fusarium acuminatum]|uniref:P-loop containing nucleoside triphosphate hydrolase protein n=1 Tax=Fusarium acuminatum TaxID=5515 RepID=A0ABZ2WKG1_9HYPO